MKPMLVADWYYKNCITTCHNMHVSHMSDHMPRLFPSQMTSIQVPSTAYQELAQYQMHQHKIGSLYMGLPFQYWHTYHCMASGLMSD